jgi:hypothetical protein
MPPKGKVCGDINHKCKHVEEPLVCSVCKVEFDRATSYYRHINTLHEGRAKPYGVPPPKPLPVTINIRADPKPIHVQATPKPPLPVPVSPKTQAPQAHVQAPPVQHVQAPPFLAPPVQTPQAIHATHTSPVPHDDPVSTMFKRLEQLEKQNNDLQREVKELKLKPTTTNYIAILGNDLYTELTNKIGRTNAMKFIAESKKPLSVFQKLYIDGRSPDDYPIACRDKYHFRYMDNQQRMVDDHGGSTIGSAVSKQISDAVAHAVHDFEIEGHVIGGRERLEQLDPDSVIKELAYITNNPNHPFFREEE